MNPQLRYQKDLDESLISEDEEQRRIVSRLQNLFEKLTTKATIKPGIHATVWRWFGAEKHRNI
ncbi:MAG: cell division protein ZapE, partial [Proteobacteria bacterium]|nr:cell division protein ZapE [Pseudomonadota bacterium]